MIDKRIKKEFEKWRNLPETPEEKKLLNAGERIQCGFYAGFRAAERLAKIEVMKDIKRSIISIDYPNNNPEELRIRDVIGYIEQQIKTLKAGQDAQDKGGKRDERQSCF